MFQLKSFNSKTLINLKTYKLKNLQTQKLTNSKTYKLKNLQTVLNLSCDDWGCFFAEKVYQNES